MQSSHTVAFAARFDKLVINNLCILSNKFQLSLFIFVTVTRNFELILTATVATVAVFLLIE
jgi:hypothetical protein